MIHEINKNHEARAAGGMERNVDLLRELNSNVAKAQELYEEAGAGLSFATRRRGGATRRNDARERRDAAVHCTREEDEKPWGE